MADTLDKFSRRTKVFYEEYYNNVISGMTGIDDFLFGIPDVDADSAQFAIDELVSTPHGVSFRERGAQSVVRPYTAGTGTIYEIERASEKTPITEVLRDAVIAGGESLESLSSREARLYRQILTQHTIAHTVTRWKLAVDVIRTGKFSPKGLNGNDIGMEIDFGRDATLDITYDFTASGSGIDTALKQLIEAYVAMNGSGDELVINIGEDWLTTFMKDDDVIERMKANTSNVLIQMNLMPLALQNVQGLRVMGRYLVPGTVYPVWLTTYKPQAQFVEYKDATAVDFFPSDEAVIFSMNAPRYKVLRGVDVLTDSGKVTRAVGDIVFDSFAEKDPVATWLRSQARYAFVPANVDHTARSTGTFPEES